MKGIAKHLMLDCATIQDFIYKYMEGELALIHKMRFNFHIKACPGCKKYFDLYSTATNPREFLENVPIPDELQNKTLDFLKDQGLLDDSNRPSNS